MVMGKADCRLILIFLWFFFYSLIDVLAHNQESYRFKSFSPEGGFYYDGVVDITQDNDRFIWILLDNDLLRFDGHEYKKYASDFRNLNAPTIWDFRGIARDSSGYLHALTSRGVFKYEKRSDSFRKIFDADITSLTIDCKNNMWCISDNFLHRIDLHNKRLIQCSFDNKPLEGISGSSFDENGIFFLSEYNKIYYCNYNQPEKMNLFYLFPSDYTIVKIVKSGKYLYALTEKQGVILLNTTNKKIEKQLQIQNKNENIPVRTLHVDKNNRIWVGTQKGLYILDPITGKQSVYLHSEADMFSLPNNSVWTIFGDCYRNIWIGTYAGELCYVNLDDTSWARTYTPQKSHLNHNIVSSFADDGKYLWIGTEGGGLNRMNKLTGDFTVYKHDENSNSLSYNNVKSLALDTQKRLWIATYQGGLNYLDTKTGRFCHFRHIPTDKGSLLGNNLRKIILEEDSALWVAYQLNRSIISRLSFGSGKFTHFELGEKEYIFDIVKDKRGNLWCITHERLYRLDIKSGAITDESTGREVFKAQSLCVDAEGNIWVGTVGHGLIKYDPSSSQFSSFRDILRSGMSAIYSLCADDSGCLWLGTDNGLFRYNIKQNSYQQFDAGDGFQGQVYYPLACMKDSSGELYFGGSSGFTVFSPYEVRFNTLPPKARISEFYIDNVPAIPTYRDSVHWDEIILNADQSNFGFKFSSDNYQSPDKNRFRYRLKGYDDRWIETDALNHTAMYSKVPAGNYQLEVMVANNNGVWSDTPMILKIERRPAFYASWPARIFYVIMVLGIASVIFYHYNGKRKLRLQIYLDDLDKQKKEELHQSQLLFFTNISHDFRTPLSLILAAVDNMKQEGLKEYYYRILHNNSWRLLNLVNELMDFRTVENNKMRLQVQPLDVNLLVTNLASDFSDYARTHHIELNVVCDSKLSSNLYVDKQILEKVVMNLLNNAFKYTSDGGKISIETYSHYSKFVPQYEYSHNVSPERTFSDEFLLVVRDTGVGISETFIGEVFERFYMVDTTNLNSHLGTGVGLALVKSLMLLHKGTISIFSERGKGTDMAVFFPTNTSVYDKKEFLGAGKDMQQIGDNKMLLETEAETDMTDIADSTKDVYSRDQKRILLVEDNDDLRELLFKFLTPHYGILEARNGAEAIAILEKTEIHLILSDIMMPVKDGITLCRELKEDINTSHIPFILLTAKSGLESRMEGADSGADLYLAKPVDFNLMLLSIRNIFKHQQHLREYYSKHYYAESAELSLNERDNAFLQALTDIIENSLNLSDIDVNRIASELSMSRSKLYSKLKMLTGKSIVEFVLNYKMRKAARLIIEEDLTMLQVMEQVGIRSASYFTNAFKKEFGESPSAFSIKHKKRKNE